MSKLIYVCLSKYLASRFLNRKLFSYITINCIIEQTKEFSVKIPSFPKDSQSYSTLALTHPLPTFIYSYITNYSGRFNRVNMFYVTLANTYLLFLIILRNHLYTKPDSTFTVYVLPNSLERRSHQVHSLVIIVCTLFQINR